MPQAKTIPVYKICPVCKTSFPVCPPGRKSRYYPPNTQVFCSCPCASKARYRRGSKCKKLSPTEAAYIAGFLDADGSIMLYKRRQKASLRVSFSNCKRQVLDWILERTGVGSFVKFARNPKHAMAYFLNLNSDAAESLLVQVEPYMIIKRERAQFAIDFQRHIRLPEFASDIAWHQEMREQMQLLNKRGA